MKEALVDAIARDDLDWDDAWFKWTSTDGETSVLLFKAFGEYEYGEWPPDWELGYESIQTIGLYVWGTEVDNVLSTVVTAVRTVEDSFSARGGG